MYRFPETSSLAVPPESTWLGAPGSLRDALLHPGNYGIHALARKNIREREGKIATHSTGVPIHDSQIRTHMRRQIHLVDDKKI
jgi:hypothetical protein